MGVEIGFNMKNIEEIQKQICNKYNATFQFTDLNLKVGISEGIKNGSEEINGVRVKEENGTSGWYFWTGEYSDDPNFFVPLHGKHLTKWAKNVIPYLGLPCGWRFLIAQEYEDVWQDMDVKCSEEQYETLSR